MLDMKIIEKSKSPYSIPIALVLKNNGEVRMRLDACKLNDKIISNRERPLTIDNILAKLENLKYMSILDLCSRYWQVPLDEDSKAPCSLLISQ